MEHQEINGQVRVTWRTLLTIAHSIMVHVRVSEAYIHFTLMCTTDHILPVPPIKELINKDGKLPPPYKIASGVKHSILNLHVLLCCTESYRTYWYKGIKHASPSAKGFSWYLQCNSKASKRVSFLCITQTEDRIFV